MRSHRITNPTVYTDTFGECLELYLRTAVLCCATVSFVLFWAARDLRSISSSLSCMFELRHCTFVLHLCIVL